jgi:hypothetical protein
MDLQSKAWSRRMCNDKAKTDQKESGFAAIFLRQYLNIKMMMN